MKPQNPTFSGKSIHAFFIRKMFAFYPPYIGAGVRVMKIGDNFDFIDVKLVLRFWNRNYVGTQFGGSLYSMCDPFMMYILIKKLGWDYIVWDKGAEIKFIRPGKGDVFAHFSLDDEALDLIKARAEVSEKVEPVYTIEVKDKEGTLVALVNKRLYIKKKKPKV
jgi:hypothetical protein